MPSTIGDSWSVTEWLTILRGLAPIEAAEQILSDIAGCRDAHPRHNRDVLQLSVAIEAYARLCAEEPEPKL